MPERRCSLQYTQTVPVVLHYTVFVPWANTFAYGQRNLFVLREYTGESVLSRRHTAQYGSGAWSEESVMLAFRHPHVFSPCTCFYSVALLQVFYESSFFLLQPFILPYTQFILYVYINVDYLRGRSPPPRTPGEIPVPSFDTSDVFMLYLCLLCNQPQPMRAPVEE